MLYFGCIGMFGVGVGMLYTPILVDRLQLEYPSGHAVANILRALTDRSCCKRSIGQLGGGTRGRAWRSRARRGAGAVDRGDRASRAVDGRRGLIVGARIGVPAAVMAVIGWLLTPYLRAIGVLGANDPFRKIGFLVGLAMIFGAGDRRPVAHRASRRSSASARAPARRAAVAVGRPEHAAARRVGRRSGGWRWCSSPRCCWASRSATCSSRSCWCSCSCSSTASRTASPTGTRSRARSSSSVLLMSAIGLRDPIIGLMAGEHPARVDHRRRRHAAGPVDGLAPGIEPRDPVPLSGGRHPDGRGAVRACWREFFMHAYPVLRIDTFAHPEAKVGIWQSAMTYKFVGAIRGIGHLASHQVKALAIGLAIGSSSRWRARCWPRRPVPAPDQVGLARASRSAGSSTRSCSGSPYASSTGGFLNIEVCALVRGRQRRSARCSPGTRPRASGGGAEGRRPARGHEHDVAGRRRPHRGRVAVRARRRDLQPARRRHRQAPRQADACDHRCCDPRTP